MRAPCLLLVSLLAFELPTAFAHAQTSPSTGSPASAGLGWDLSVGLARGSRGGRGDEAMTGHQFAVARGRWLGRWFRLRTNVEYHDLRRATPRDCAATCAPFESRRRVFGTGLELSVHHTTERWHAYPVLGVGAAYVRATGVASRVGVTRALGVGVAVPAPGGWPTLAVEGRVVRVPHASGSAWHLPISLAFRF